MCFISEQNILTAALVRSFHPHCSILFPSAEARPGTWVLGLCHLPRGLPVSAPSCSLLPAWSPGRSACLSTWCSHEH